MKLLDFVCDLFKKPKETEYLGDVQLSNIKWHEPVVVADIYGLATEFDVLLKLELQNKGIETESNVYMEES